MIEIFKELGVLGVLGALIVYLLQKISSHLLNKDVQKYQLELDQKTEKYKNGLSVDLERYKSELLLIHNKITKLHDKRLDHIEEIYFLITDFHDQLQLLINWKVVTGKTKEEIAEDELEQVKIAEKAGNKFLKYYARHKLYFSKETSEIIDSIIKLLRDSHTDFTFKYVFGTGSPEFEIDRIKGITTNLRDKVPPLKKELEENFRSIMGVS